MTLMEKFEKKYLFGKVLIWKNTFLGKYLFRNESFSKSICFEKYLFLKLSFSKSIFFEKNVLFQLTVIIFWFNLLNNYNNDHLHLYFIQKISN